MTMYHNLWGAAKAELREKFKSLNAYIRKKERSKINDLTFHLKKVENEKQSTMKINRRKEIIKIGAQINEIENKNENKKFNKAKG